jgi:hypothetical protein
MSKPSSEQAPRGNGTSGHDQGSEETMRSLARLADVLRGTGEEFEQLADRCDRLRNELAEGMSLTDAMAAEARPLIVTSMTRLTEDLRIAALALRRAEARQLQGEGLSHEKIAAFFGVSRQRVGVLLSDHQG